MSEGYEALRHGGAAFDLSTRGRIIARGRDRARLLHNLTSNEVKKLTPGAGCYAFLLSPKGRIQADLTLWCFPDHFLIDTEPELREKVAQHIRKYIIADQVELEDVTEQTSEVSFEGPGAAAILGQLGAPMPGDYASATWGESIVAGATVTGQPGARIYCASQEAAGLIGRFEALGGKRATSEDARLVRIENGKPRYGDDIRDTTLPQETQQMHAVSFSKGCYVRQEIVERIRAQGHVNKKLVRLEAAGSEPLVSGTKLTAGDTDAGEVTSAIFSPQTGKVAAMGYVRTSFAEAGTALRAGDVEARVL